MATTKRIDVMISSTALDLPEHRKQVMDAILRMGMHPIGMEHLSAMNADAIDASLAMVDEAEIYVGIFAHRYGYIPDSPKNPKRLSVTEMEYRRAVERDIPRLIFIMADDHPIDAKMLETNPEGAQKLLLLKNELKANYVASFFKSQDNLREQVLTSLSAYRNRELSTVETIHYVRDIPTAPEPYIAHPYTLLQTGDVVGRRAELSLLTDWVAKPDSEVYQARILNFVAIGGMGKSALTWKWFNEIAPQEMKPLAGRLWWSFYESDASFENFIIRALAYVSGRSREEIAKDTKPGEREEQLLQILNQQPFLLVLDGLERILIAYARMDAAHLSDDEIDKQTANRVAGAIGLPESAGQSFVGEHRLRKTADPRAGSFLRKLAAVQKSRILVSTRLYPVDLQNVTGYPLPGCFAIFLKGLQDDDAVELWREMGVSGSRDTLLPVFRQFENYPLLIRALAGEVARYKRAPGDFDAWLKTYPDFQRILNGLYQQDAKSHVLSYALQGLTEDEKRVLHTIAAFRMPASYDTLVALLVEKPSPPTPLPTSRYRSLGEGSPAAFGSGEELRQENGRYREMAAQVMVTLARDLRQRQTTAEDRLWQCLRDRRLNDLKFRRQHPIAKTTYIADFFCYQAKLVIELDGGIHDTQQEQDARRQQEIEALGYRVLRFRNERIESDLETVLVEILEAAMPSSPTILPQGEGSQTAAGDEKTPGLEALANGEMDSPLPGSASDWSGEGQGVRASHGVRAKTRITTESALDTILFALEDRGVLGWDRAANRYDLHPIVRSVVWGGLDSNTRDSIYSTRVSHFEPIAKIDDDKIEKFEDLTPTIELYHTLIGLGRYDDARDLYYERLQNATLYRLSASRQQIELLERLFPDGIDQLPRLNKASD